MSISKNKGESFNTRAQNVVGTNCFLLVVTNYGKKKSSFDFYTPSDRYAKAKKEIILKLSPEAKVEIEQGVIDFKLYKGAQ